MNTFVCFLILYERNSCETPGTHTVPVCVSEYRAQRAWVECPCRLCWDCARFPASHHGSEQLRPWACRASGASTEPIRAYLDSASPVVVASARSTAEAMAGDQAEPPGESADRDRHGDPSGSPAAQPLLVSEAAPTAAARGAVPDALQDVPTRRLVVVLLLCAMLLTAFLSLFGAAAPPPPPPTGPARLVLVSIDGFRHDYFDRRLDGSAGRGAGGYAAPTLRKLASRGVRASMQPVFPSKTFPNHNSIATGLLPAWSGIVGNVMFDERRRKWFHVSLADPEWWKGEPVWRTLQRAGRKTGTVFWPGSDVPGRTADAFWSYNGSTPYADRVDRVVDLLTGSAPELAGHPVDFSTLYFESVDHAGHKHGPDSPEVTAAIAEVDSALSLLLERVPSLNIVVVSDHGMSSVNEARVVDLDSALEPDEAVSIVTSPVLMLQNMSGPAAPLLERLRKEMVASGHGRVFAKELLPERWHLRTSDLVPPIVGLADARWSLEVELAPRDEARLSGGAIRATKGDSATGHWTRAVKQEEEKRPHPENHPVKGDHGYDNEEPDMQATFIAGGPVFRARETIKNMSALDVYPLLCHIFSASAAPNNGSLMRTQHVVRSRL